MKTIKMKLLLGVTLPALLLGGCTAENGTRMASLSDAITGKSAMKISTSESLLQAEKGLWDLYEQEDQIDPVAMHKMARAQVNPSDKSKKRFLTEERLAMAAGAPSGNDQNHRIIRVARADITSAAREEIMTIADASAMKMPVPPLTKPSFAKQRAQMAKKEDVPVQAQRVAEASIQKRNTQSVNVMEVIFGGGNKKLSKAVARTNAERSKRTPVEFVASANTPRPQNKPAHAITVASADAEVEQMRLGEHPNKTRLVLDLSGEVNYRTELDASGKYLTVELPHAGWRTKTHSALQSALISGYTAEPSASGQGTRLKLELKKPVKLIGAAALRPDHGKPHRIYFDIGAA